MIEQEGAKEGRFLGLAVPSMGALPTQKSSPLRAFLFKFRVDRAQTPATSPSDPVASHHAMQNIPMDPRRSRGRRHVAVMLLEQQLNVPALEVFHHRRLGVFVCSTFPQRPSES